MYLSWDNSLLDKLYQVGFNPDFGARPIKRAIQRIVENDLAKEILKGKFEDGAKINLSYDNDLVISVS